MSILSLAKRFRGRRGAGAEEQTARTGRAARAEAAALLPFDLVPLMSEKSIRLQEVRTVAFRVPMHATKQSVAQAVRLRFKVEPRAVRVLIMQPKSRRRGRTVGRTSWWKKAYVTVEDAHALGIQP